MKSFWNCNRLFFEDLPTVRDLIWNADWDILSKEVAEYCECDDGESRISEVRGALEEMMGLDIRRPSDKWAFLPYESYSEDVTWGALNWGIEAALLRRSDFKTMAELSRREKLLDSARDCEKALKRECKRLKGKYPDLHSWDSSSWEKVLSFRVWMQGQYSRKERYRMIACIVAGMVVYGSTSDEARSERHLAKQWSRACSENKGAGKKRTSPAELLLRDYGLESSTDDYEREFEKRMKDAAVVLNYNASVDLHRRVADFVKREKRADKENIRIEAHSLNGW